MKDLRKTLNEQGADAVKATPGFDPDSMIPDSPALEGKDALLAGAFNEKTGKLDKIFFDVDDVDQDRVQSIIDATNQQDSEAALAFGDEVSAQIEQGIKLASDEQNLRRLKELSSRISDDMDEVKDAAEETTGIEDVFELFKDRKRTFVDAFMKAVKGQEYEEELQKREREEKKRRRAEIKDRLSGFISGHDQRVQNMRLYQAELPAVARFVERADAINSDSFENLKLYVAAAQRIIRDFEENKDDLQEELGYYEFQDRQTFIATLKKRHLLLSQEYAAIVTNRSQLDQLRDTVTYMREALSGILNHEMKVIEKNTLAAGRAIQLLELYDLLNDYEENIEDIDEKIDELMYGPRDEDDKKAKRRTRRPQKDLPANMLNYLKALRNERQEKSLKMVDLKDQIHEASKALNEMITENLIEEVDVIQDYAKQKLGGVEQSVKKTKAQKRSPK